MAEHRVPALRAALRRVDPERSSDPNVRQLVSALSALEVAPAPRAEFRADLRAQLVAVTPRLVEEGTAEVKTERETVGTRAPQRSRVRLGKPLLALAGAVAAVVLLLGGAVAISRHALPGDTLYGLKRASENTQYSLTGGTVAKGKLKLEFAGRRIGEVSSLLPRASALAGGRGAVADNGALSAQTSKLVQQTLDSADSDVRTGAQMLGGAAVRGKTAQPLIIMTKWAPAEIAAMNAIAARIPSGSLHDRAINTLHLITAANQRDVTLQGELGCSCLGSSGTDSLGPIPCSTGCSSTGTVANPTSGQPGPGGTSTGAKLPTPGGTGSTTGVGIVPTGTSTSGTTGGTLPGQPGSSSTPGIPISSKPHIPLPTLPTLPGLPTRSGLPTLPTSPILHSASLPLTVSSSCIKASLGPIGVGVGKC